VLSPEPLALAGVQGVKYAAGDTVKPQHDARYWEKATAGFDFSGPDRMPPGKFNRVIWKGLMGDEPYPVRPGLLATQTKPRGQSPAR
jgi:hypothetical protein